MVALTHPFNPHTFTPATEGNFYVAMRYADLGMRVFPCDNRPDNAKRPGTPSKQPLVKWKDEATTNIDQLIEWWTTWPNAIVGLVMGELVWCVDCDRHDAQADGVTAFATLIKEHGGVFPDPVPYSHTISDGQHFYFALPDDFIPNNSRGRLPSGVDVRGLGGFVVAPGSECSFGGWRETGARLTDMVEDGTVPPAPDWLLEMIRPAKLSELAKPTGAISTSIQVLPPEADQEELIEALSRVPADEREIWVRFGAALHDTGAPWARSLWDSWSQTSPKFNARDQELTWKSFGRPYNGSRATVASIFHEAKRHGYERRSWVNDLPAWDGVLRGPGFTQTHTTEAVAAKPAPTGFEFPFYGWRPTSDMEPREWLYGTHLIRGFVSVTVAPGGVGKSSLTMVEALAMASNRPLLGISPAERKALNVALWNGEDPIDELERRMGGAARFYQVDETTCQGGLFLLSGRDQPIIIADTVRHDLVVAKPMVEAVKAAILARRLDVLIIDPFVSSHRVSENDNMAIDVVAKQWASIAHETGCAVELVHHARKSNGDQTTAEDARGASSLISAARSVRVLNPMSEEQADLFGVAEHRRAHFHVTYGKSSMSALDDKLAWHKIESVGLGNFRPGRDEDHVGVVTLWKPPKIEDDVLTTQLREVQTRLKDGDWRENSQSEKWAGKVVADVLELDPSDKQARDKIKRLLGQWIKDGLLVVEEWIDERRRPRKVIVPGRSIDHFKPKSGGVGA
jgi:hypothetical protein